MGRLTDAEGRGEAGSSRCGDQVRIDLAVTDGRIRDARFQAYGCPAAIAAASELIGRLPGLSVLGAARLGTEGLRGSLDLAPGKRSCCAVAVDALHTALEDVVRKDAVGLVPAHNAADRSGVLVGMSGGVDSSVAALLLLEQGFHVVGVTFRLWSDPVCGTGRTCCSPETVLEARRLAHQLGVPHLTVDLSADFYRQVVEPFVQAYRRARTPNPCVRCNAALRFMALAGLADRLGLAAIATGHYARVDGDGRLLRGVDLHKDQSYVLAEVPPALLRRARFPLGELDKPATRTRARGRGLHVHDAPESQDICFIPDGDYRRFLAERLGDAPGDIVDRGGRRLGGHRGVYRYTIGQRRGLGLASAEPLYVVALDPDGRSVVVGPGAEAEVDRVLVADVVRHGSMSRRGMVQLRSSGAPVPALVTDEGDRVTLALEEPVKGVAPGQAAVLYEGPMVVLSGTIVETGRGRRTGAE